jgi:dihydrolipoyl dehydrogenase
LDIFISNYLGMESYDVVVIGGGPSGFASAMRAVDFKKKVLLIERDSLGGAGIYNGALSSKTWWELSRQSKMYQDKLRRYNMTPPQTAQWSDFLSDVQDATDERGSLLTQQVEWLKSTAAVGKFFYKKGNARLISDHEIEIASKEGKEICRSENIVLATGSRPRFIEGIPIDEKTVVTSDGIHNFSDFPKSLVIVGAGVIGCEFATIFSNFQRTKVNIIARDDRILPFEDSDVTEIIEENLAQNGVEIHHNTDLHQMEVRDGKVYYETKNNKDGKIESYEVENALISIGRVPNIEGLGLEDIGIEMSKRGHIIDNDTQTSIPNIYAVGDLTADIALVNVGELEGRYAIEKMYGTSRKPMVYDNISTIMFLSPETAGVGLNEQQAQEKGLSYKVVSLGFETIPRAIAMRRTQGFFKILVTDDDEMKIMGMRALGEHASTAIQAVALLIATNNGIEELAELIHPHPSIIEGIQECVRMFLGKSIIKPGLIGNKVVCRRFHNGVYEDLGVMA